MGGNWGRTLQIDLLLFALAVNCLVQVVSNLISQHANCKSYDIAIFLMFNYYNNVPGGKLHI
jgi:hypothetical protein